MKLNLKELEIERVDGNIEIVDARKNIANILYDRVSDIALMDKCRCLYYAGEEDTKGVSYPLETEFTEVEVAELKAILNTRCMTAIVTKAILKQLNN